MARYRRDGALALATLTLLVAISFRRGVAGSIVSPTAILVGGLGMVTIERVLLRYPERTRVVWERPAVRAGSVLAAVALGVGGTLTGYGGFVLGALVWGLVAYLTLLGIVACTGTNPLAGGQS